MSVLNVLVSILVFLPPEIIGTPTVGFDRNFFYDLEGGTVEICLEVKNFAGPITGKITTIDDGTATEGMDYIPVQLPVYIASDPLGPDCNYHIQLQSDDNYEGFETFSVTFTTSDANVQIKRGVAQVSIIDDDDVDECALGADNCHDTLAECTNTDGSFECKCKEGYSGDGVTCQ